MGVFMYVCVCVFTAQSRKIVALSLKYNDKQNTSTIDEHALHGREP